MNHGEGWYFIQLGRYMERACGLSLLLDAHFAEANGADDLDWVGLLTSCAAVEAYRKVNTSNVSPECVADWIGPQRADGGQDVPSRDWLVAEGQQYCHT